MLLIENYENHPTSAFYLNFPRNENILIFRNILNDKYLCLVKKHVLRKGEFFYEKKLFLKKNFQIEQYLKFIAKFRLFKKNLLNKWSKQVVNFNFYSSHFTHHQMS